MRCHLVIALLVFSTSSFAQERKPDAKPGDAMIEKYLAAETDKLAAKYLDGAKTIDEWKAKRPRLYQEYMDMLGLWPMPEKTPLKATVTGEIEAHGVIVEKLHFQSKPGLYVTANVYRPKASRERERPEKHPAIVYVCGHSSKGRDGNKTAFQDHGFWFANNGYVCIILDTLQLGEIPGVHHGTYGRPWGHLKQYPASNDPKASQERKRLEEESTRFWWHSIGYSPAAVECWNGIRAIDYLCTRSDVDPDRIGVTGISGGGAATFWIAAADDRVKVAVPVSGMADLEYYVKQKGVNSHCDCMFLHNTYQWGWTTIAALVAPRPMLFANSDKDPIFPMDANRRVMAKLRKIYGMYDADKAVQEYVSVGGHDYRPDLRKAIFHFFNLHLKRQPTPLVHDSDKYTPLKGRDLRVFPEDRDLPKDAINHRIDETFIPPAKVALPEKGKFEEWKKGMIAKLREKSFRELAASFPTARSLGRIDPINYGFSSELGIEFATSGIISDPKGIAVTLVVLNLEDDAESLVKWCERFDGDRYVGVVYGRGPDHTKKSPPNYLERSHLLVGKTWDTGRLIDIASLQRNYSESSKNKNEKHRIAGIRQAGIIAAYAALFEPSIKEVVVIDPPKSHKEGPHFLNVLRVLDIPEALGLLAPTPLTIIGGLDPAFDRTAEIYRLAGAADKLTRK